VREEIRAGCKMELEMRLAELLADLQGVIGMGEHTNRAFWRHWATSEGRVLVTWRFLGSAEAS
jgi:hypothetical protein